MVDAHGRVAGACASTSAVRRRGSRCRPTGRRCTSTTSWTARSACTTCAPLLDRRRAERPAARHAGRGRDRERLAPTVLLGKQLLLRRARHAPGARPLHELRQLPQRRRPATAASGTSPGSAKACATPSRCAGAPACAGPCCTGAPTSTRCRTSKAQIRALAGGTGLMSDAAFATGTRSQPLGDPRPASAPTWMPWRPTSNSLDTLRRQPVPRQRRRAERGRRPPAGPCSKRKNCAGVPRRVTAFTYSAPDGPAEHRHPQAEQRAAPGRPADRHRHADAARRVANRPVSARRLGGDARGGGAVAQRRDDLERGPHLAGRGTCGRSGRTNPALQVVPA